MIEDFRVDTVEYLPRHLRRIDEYRAISACVDVWVKKIWDLIDHRDNGLYVGTIDEDGCKRIEDMLGLSSGGTLDSRQRQISGVYVSSLPYTQKKVLETLRAMCQSRNVTMDVDYSKYAVTITIRVDAYGYRDQLFDKARRMIPANMTLNLVIIYNVWSLAERYTWDGMAKWTWGQVLTDDAFGG